MNCTFRFWTCIFNEFKCKHNQNPLEVSFLKYDEAITLAAIAQVLTVFAWKRDDSKEDRTETSRLCDMSRTQNQKKFKTTFRNLIPWISVHLTYFAVYRLILFNELSLSIKNRSGQCCKCNLKLIFTFKFIYLVLSYFRS